MYAMEGIDVWQTASELDVPHLRVEPAGKKPVNLATAAAKSI